MMANDDLHPLLSSINKTIARVREDIHTLVGEIKKIAGLLERGFEDLRDAIHENIQAQAELKLLEHVMEVRSVKPQLEAEREQIEIEQAELDERFGAIESRYERKHEELDETAAERVRTLGSHIFSIDEEEFEEGIERPFVEHVTDTWHQIHAHNVEVGENRRTTVTNSAGDTIQTVHEFVDRQRALVDEIEAHRLDLAEGDDTIDQRTQLQIPFFEVEYEVDGELHRTRIVPSTVDETVTGDEWCSIELRPIADLGGLTDGFDGLDRERSSLERLDRRTVVETIEDAGREPAIGLSYAEAVAIAVPDRIPVHLPDGEA